MKVLLQPLQRAWDWLAVQPHQRKGLRALQTCIGLMLLFRASTEGPFASYLWGPHGIGVGSSVAFLAPSVVPYADRIFSVRAGPYLLVVLMAVAALCLIFGVWTRLACGLALLSSLFLAARLPELGDGGDNITRLVLTYMLFALPDKKEVQPGSLQVWFHNVAVLAVGLQIGVLYLTSGLLKATGEKWTHGTAMYLISQVEWFSLPAMRGMFHNPYLTTLVCYVTFFFQLWFPIAVLTRLRPIWLAVGICFHLGIALFMGLLCFSTAMIGLELFLVTDAHYAVLARWWDAFKAWIGPRLRRPAWSLGRG